MIASNQKEITNINSDCDIEQEFMDGHILCVFFFLKNIEFAERTVNTV